MSKAMNIFRKFVTFFQKSPEAFSKNENELSEEDVIALKHEFKKRYHAFQLLLKANNQALEIMSEMEGALSGSFHFDMPFVRSRLTAVVVAVKLMKRRLNIIAPGKYAELTPVFNDIRVKLDRTLNNLTLPVSDMYTVSLNEADDASGLLIGGKMGGLVKIRNVNGVGIPKGFIITTSAYQKFLTEKGINDEINRLFLHSEFDDKARVFKVSEKIIKLIMNEKLPEAVSMSIKKEMDILMEEAGTPPTFALRSSAFMEDSEFSSFAGQFHTELNALPHQIETAYKKVVAGKYSPKAISYRLRLGLRDEDLPMAVGVTQMVSAKCGGVAYTRNPVDFMDDTLHITSVFGLPKMVVDGEGTCDYFVVRKNDGALVHKRIGAKKEKLVQKSEGGVGFCPLPPEESGLSSVNEDMRAVLVKTLIEIEKHLGAPQDVEWAFDEKNRLIILQCRPLRIRRKSTSSVSRYFPESDRLARGGITASPGIFSGIAYVAEKNEDLLTVPENAVLVVRAPRPRWSVVLGKIGAVVSEEGGIANHLACIAREMGKPSLFSVPNITALIKTGDELTVDADAGMIFKGLVEDLGIRKKRTVNIMAGTPVFRVLKKACRHITPLNLMDPDSIYFQPENCRTLHDITRFIHEKSVKEMIRFGKNNTFSQHSAKQLVVDKTPMQWWVLNLDNGFSKEVSEKFVDMENIASIPMRAFWKGFTAVKWDGPPVPSKKGLFSVMFNSTANPELISGIKTRYTDQNYFMISENYCSINSRLGYHFFTMESFVGERDVENYVGFQFKGGATNLAGRTTRVNLIGEIMEDFGFNITIRQDHLRASKQARPQNEILDKLKIIGYLSLHTRQLDAALSNENRLKHYKDKFKKDIVTKVLTYS